MKYINLFKSGEEISQIALGCMRIAEMAPAEADRYLMESIELGYNYFDHADIYGGGKSENVFGEALKRNKSARDKIFIQTKCSIRGGMYDFSKEHIIASVEGSLTRLGVEKIDALLLHRPDLLMEPYEVAEAFEKLEREGKVEHFGVSNHSPMQIELLERALNKKLLINQLQLSLANAGMISSGANVNLNNDDGINRDGYIRDYCRLNGITIQPWSPLQHGFISGCFIGNDSFPELNKKISEMAEKYAVSEAAVAIAWLLRLPDKMQPIVGSTSIERLRDIAKASEIELSARDWYELYLAAGYKLP